MGTIEKAGGLTEGLKQADFVGTWESHNPGIDYGNTSFSVMCSTKHFRTGTLELAHYCAFPGEKGVGTP